MDNSPEQLQDAVAGLQKRESGASRMHANSKSPQQQEPAQPPAALPEEQLLEQLFAPHQQVVQQQSQSLMQLSMNTQTQCSQLCVNVQQSQFANSPLRQVTPTTTALPATTNSSQRESLRPKRKSPSRKPPTTDNVPAPAAQAKAGVNTDSHAVTEQVVVTDPPKKKRQRPSGLTYNKKLCPGCRKSCSHCDGKWG